jgi:hypothetical protein
MRAFYTHFKIYKEKEINTMKIRRRLVCFVYVCTAILIFSASVFAATESLNGGGATWYGGENTDEVLFSILRDNYVDGIRFKVTVWVKNDKKVKKEKTGITNGVGKKGEVKVTMASTHSNPFVPERTGYKDFICLAAN